MPPEYASALEGVPPEIASALVEVLVARDEAEGMNRGQRPSHPVLVTFTPKDGTADLLRRMAEKHGIEVQEAWLAKDYVRGGVSKGYGFIWVELDSLDAALALDGTEFEGKTFRLKLGRPLNLVTA